MERPQWASVGRASFHLLEPSHETATRRRLGLCADDPPAASGTRRADTRFRWNLASDQPTRDRTIGRKNDHPRDCHAAPSSQTLSGRRFDQEYIQVQVADHEKTIPIFETEAKQGQNTMIKNFAQNMIPVLQQHLAEAKALAGGSATTERERSSATERSGRSSYRKLGRRGVGEHRRGRNGSIHGRSTDPPSGG